MLVIVINTMSQKIYHWCMLVCIITSHTTVNPNIKKSSLTIIPSMIIPGASRCRLFTIRSFMTIQSSNATSKRHWAFSAISCWFMCRDACWDCSDTCSVLCTALTGWNLIVCYNTSIELRNCKQFISLYSIVLLSYVWDFLCCLYELLFEPILAGCYILILFSRLFSLYVLWLRSYNSSNIFKLVTHSKQEFEFFSQYFVNKLDTWLLPFNLVFTNSSSGARSGATNLFKKVHV